MREGDTIAALSSGAPPSGVAVIRLSGPLTADVLRSLAGKLPIPRKLQLAQLYVDEILLDQALIVWFPGPASFTGEDCAELHLHGSPAVVRAALRYLVAVGGVRLAEAGEFTRRAFANGKLDLTEVEGLGDLIDAETESQRRQALGRFQGGISRDIENWRQRLIDLRAEVEARLDFSDEDDVEEVLPLQFTQQLRDLGDAFNHGLASIEHGRVIREGLRIALAGPPNAGKSSLLNVLARSEVAIVTDEPGTTRDVKEVRVDLGGQLVVLLDLAGLREASSKAEIEGVRRAMEEISGADLVLWLNAPDVQSGTPDFNTAAPIWTIATKTDLGMARGGGEIEISIKTGLGLAALVSKLTSFAESYGGDGTPGLLSRERDRVALATAAMAMEDALADIVNLELVAEALRRASQALERLLGRLDAESILDRLFSAFCIGK